MKDDRALFKIFLISPVLRNRRVHNQAFVSLLLFDIVC